MSLYVIRFFTWGAWSILFTFFAVWLVTSSPFSAADIALIAGTLAMTNRAGGLLFTRWIGTVDFRGLMICMQGLLMAAIIWLQWLHLHQIHTLAAWLLGVAALGIANSVSTLAQLTFIACGNTRDDRVTAFAKENVALNLSAGMTPYLSALVLASFPEWYLLFALLYCLPTIALCMRVTVHKQPVQAPAEQSPVQAPAPDTARRVRFLAINFLSFFAFAQLYNVFPLYAEGSLGAEQIGLFFAASSVLIVVLQIPLTRLCARRQRRDLIIVANLALAIGVYALLFATQKMSAMVTALLLLTLAEMLFGPLYQAMSITLFPQRPAFAMAILTFTWAVAETAATTLGVYLVAQGQADALFTLAAVAAALVVVIVWGRRHSTV